MSCMLGNPFAEAAQSLGALRRPRRVSVSAGAAEALVLDDPGGYTGPWDPDGVQYLIEPMDMLASRHHSAVCFVGPARAGKTAGLILGWLAHAVTNDIGRMMIMHMNEAKASMLSKLDVDTAIEASDRLRELRSPRAHDNTVGLKIFRHGMAVRFAHPSRAEAAGTTYRYVALTDYDRFTRQKNMGGSMFDSALKRTQTLMSRGMTLVESSPERQMTDAHWRPATPHEAPPCGGILGIYNRSDRRRWYWRCPHCGEWFEAAPGIGLFSLPKEDELLEIVRTIDISSYAAEKAKVICPVTGCVIEHSEKHEMNRRGRWVPDGMSVIGDGELIGDMPSSTIAGYWLGGVAAAYQPWQSLVEGYLHGLREYALSGDEKTLEAKTYVDQASPYTPRHLLADKSASIEDRKDAALERYHVPAEARFLVATADVQGGSNGRFVCEVRAFGPGLTSWLVDRFSITHTERDGVTSQVDPAGYPEDWDLLTARLVQATYRLGDGRELRVLKTGVDTGGEAGTTPNAYAWLRRLRRAGLSSRVMLLKGGSHDQSKPVVQGTARDNRGKPMRDMPVWIINTDYFKDIVAASLRRLVPGPGYFHVADWLPQSYFEELRAEVRDAAGKWKKVRARNEALDLWVYALAICEAIGFGPKGRLSWDEPPEWALPLDGPNSELTTREERHAARPAADQKRASAPSPIANSEWASRL